MGSFTNFDNGDTQSIGIDDGVHGQAEGKSTDFARRMGTSHSAISRIEGGQHPSSVETLRRLAAALDTHLVVGFSDAEPDADAERELVAIT